MKKMLQPPTTITEAAKRDFKAKAIDDPMAAIRLTAAPR
jgi:hypothetical protein